jgi:hypothetical protein
VYSDIYLHIYIYIDLNSALEEHLLELSAQRTQLLSVHGKDMDGVKEQLLQAKEKYR